MKRKGTFVSIAIVLMFVGALLWPHPWAGVEAKEYPERAITLVVPYAPGGVTDLGARALADAMQKQLKQPVVVVNKPGGGTTIGGNAVAAARPDGYTLGFFPTSAAIPEVFGYFYEAPYSSKDLQTIAHVAGPVLAVTVKADSPFNSIKDLVEYAKKNPDVKVATHGKSTLGFLVMATIGKAENVRFTDVPFAGDSLITPAILGGHVLVGTPAYPAIKSLLDAKKLKVLALCIEKRAEFAPDIPTVVELGYKLAFVSFLGVYAPKGTPAEIVKRLDAVISGVTKEADFRSKMHGMGTIVTYESTVPFEKTQAAYKANLELFFKEQGLVKGK
jgi:tripartite-type tricarboxylate transporter receptor subunit TctC